MNVPSDLMRPIQHYTNHYDWTVPLTFGVPWPVDQVPDKPRYTFAVYDTRTASLDLPLGIAADVSYMTALSTLVRMMEAKVREYENLLSVAPDVTQVEQVEYRLEPADSSTRRLLSRMASVNDSDHDVFVDYAEDPLFS